MVLSMNERGQIILQAETETDSDALLEQLHLSRKTRYFHYAQRKIMIGGRIITQKQRMSAGDALTITPIAHEERIPAWDHPLQVLYEDELFLIVNKESGMLVHSDGVNTERTLCNAVQHHYDLSAGTMPVRPLHRLDVETSGILLFCKIPLIQPLLDQMMEAHQIRRSYLAIVSGRFPAKTQRYRDPIARDRHDARRMIVHPKGKDALTSVSLLRYSQASDRSLVRCVLGSGRTHQIRVHLAHHHYPLVHDALYGRRDGPGRLALHSAHVELWHPLRHEMLKLDCPLPADLQELIK